MHAPDVTNRPEGRGTRTVSAPPRAGALVESMRDIGYSLGTAIADLIDNSITAGARNVDIRATFSGSESKIGIIDDGLGMGEEELIAAMRLGSRSPTEYRAPSDLGRFGLGLKTASFSQCRRLTVLSRPQASDGVTLARWDLDVLVEQDDWRLHVETDPTGVPWMELLPTSGTLVLWEHLDRLVGRGGELREEEFNRMLSEVQDHLALVFYRFLEGSHGAPKVEIHLNGSPLVPVDPFFRSHRFTEEREGHPIRLGKTEMVLRAYTLPHHSRVTRAEWERMGGPEGHFRNQGFYVFRGNRMIIHGTWFGITRQTELTKLTRVSVDLPNELDFEWKVDMKKASAQPPPEVRKHLRNLLDNLGSRSKFIHSSKGSRQVSRELLPLWVRHQRTGRIHYAVNADHPLVRAFEDGLPDELAGRFRDLKALLAAALPTAMLHHDVSTAPTDLGPDPELEARLPELAIEAAAGMKHHGFTRDDVMLFLRTNEPFATSWEAVEPRLLAYFESTDSSDA